MEKQIATISMTGFAAGQGGAQGYDWSWDIRSVNGKALDLRFRLPDVEGLEPLVRTAVGRFAARGNISANLRLTRVDAAEGLRLSASGLRAALAALRDIESVAAAEGMALAQTTAADVLTLRGVLEQGPVQMEDPAALRTALIASLEGVLTEFAAMRAAEGAQIGAVISAQLTRIAELTEAAAEAAEARRPDWEAGITAALARVIEGAGGADPDRVAQELALIAVKGDVTEEIDRLRAHIAAARDLLADPKPVGRRFDFLTQEFVREANTLCSKSGSSRLTAIGLDLKHVIDQMREQIQNVE
ncbi:YicC/YloC family endoribonuclease [Sedimentimonas flavescens]|uniref:YicC/YloC family endoribonuclease n=1 Tax=Sedimentimonas flavescens TaxID=2851012 RepID=UPI0021A430D1|nr:YicC/YloC family endoribonuclease [Sedimentimonas flavescens]MCT2538406.1 YicC family protein [Sedimentimonas flavescens]